MSINYLTRLEQITYGFNKNMSLLELAEFSGLPFTWVVRKLKELSKFDPTSYPPSKVEIYKIQCKNILDERIEVALKSAPYNKRVYRIRRQ